MFKLAVKKDGSVAKHIFSWMGRYIWCFCPDRVLLGLEQQLAQVILNRLVLIYLCNSANEVLWVENSEFTVKSTYTRLVGKRFEKFPIQCCNDDLLVSKVWRTMAPSKVAFFVWLVLRRRALTQEKLQERGYRLASRCPLCMCHVESNDHFFKLVLSKTL